MKIKEQNKEPLLLEIVTIQNYRSIQDFTIDLGRFNIFISANGSGKSNILEAIALGASSISEELEDISLSSRGIKVTEPQFMRAGFDRNNITKDIKIMFKSNYGFEYNCILSNDNSPFSKWFNKSINGTPITQTLAELYKDDKERSKIQKLPAEHKMNSLNNFKQLLSNFLIYSPENEILKNFAEGGRKPLGIKGEGFFKLLKILENDRGKIKKLKEHLELIDWFKDFSIPQNLLQDEKKIELKDQYLDPKLKFFDQKSSNEGFLFLLFYFTLFISEYTPKFFAIDNIDSSLNPKLCSELIKRLVKLCYEYDKQVIITTHNPAILDGLNLNDEKQRLFVILRNKPGYTKALRITKKQIPDDQLPVRLSEQFLRGYIGGLPKNF